MINNPQMSITDHDEAEKDFIEKTTKEIQSRVGNDYYVTYLGHSTFGVSPVIKSIQVSCSINLN